MIRISTFAAAAIAAAISCASFAQSAIHYGEGERVDPTDVARILSAQPKGPMRMRSIRLLDGPAQAQTGPSAMSLPVRFGFDSAEIEPSALPQLEALASGIKLLPDGQRVAIEGHTDATGSPAYNLRLSERRAQAVKQYLVTRHGIDSGRLSTSGLGEKQPIDGSNPYEGRNRRVQFHGG